MITTHLTPSLRAPKMGTTPLDQSHMPKLTPLSLLICISFLMHSFKCVTFIALFKFNISLPRNFLSPEMPVFSPHSVPIQIVPSHQGLASVTIDHHSLLGVGGRVVYYMLGTVLNALHSLRYVQASVLLSFLLCRQRHEGLGN